MNPLEPKPRVVVPNTTVRDRLIAIAIGVAVLGFVIFGVLNLSKKNVSENILVGVVEEKQTIPRREEQIAFNGRKLEGTKTIDGDYVLKVRVEKEGRTYDVPVEKWIYEAKKKGDKLEFVRPPSEQK